MTGAVVTSIREEVVTHTRAISSTGRCFTTVIFDKDPKLVLQHEMSPQNLMSQPQKKPTAKPIWGLLSGPKLRARLVLSAFIFHVFHLVITRAQGAKL